MVEPPFVEHHGREALCAALLSQRRTRLFELLSADLASRESAPQDLLWLRLDRALLDAEHPDDTPDDQGGHADPEQPDQQHPEPAHAAHHAISAHHRGYLLLLRLAGHPDTRPAAEQP